ncbi:MAG: CdaR family protein [Clostridia bacterium]|nr:CdaR family protein [Clostridia bacterium]
MMDWMRKNDVFTRLFALACAFLLWLYVVSSTNPDMSQTFSKVPVEFVGTEMLSNNDLVIIEGGQSTVAFKVSGKSDRVSTVEQDSVRVTADVSNITAPGTYNLKYQVSTSVSDITINKITSSVTIVVDRMVSQTVPIDLTLSGKLDEGYILDKSTMKPDAITVTAPQSVLDTIVSAKAAYDISGLRESMETTIGYALINSSGAEVKSPYLTTNTPSIQLALNIRQTGEIPLLLNVIDFGFITDEVVDITLEPASIKINGNPEIVSTLNHIDIGSINLETIFTSEEFTFDLPVILPNGVTSEENVSSVRVTIDTTGLKKTTLRISSDSLPESTAFDYVSDLSVEVWTTENHTASLSARSVDVELSYYPDDLKEGFNEIPIVVTAVDESVVVVGEYSVVVEVPTADPGVEP